MFFITTIIIIIISIAIINHHHLHFAILAILPLFVLTGRPLTSFTSDDNWVEYVASFTLPLLPRSFHSPPVAYCYLYPYSIFCICLTLPSFKYSLPQSSLKRERKEVCCLASESLQYYLMAEQYSVLLPLIIWLMNALWLEFNFPPLFTIINNCTIAAREGLLWITQMQS